jgi:hypothetical protein
MNSQWKGLEEKKTYINLKFSIGQKNPPEINKEIYVVVKEWKLQHKNVVTFRSELRFWHEYSHLKSV